MVRTPSLGGIGCRPDLEPIRGPGGRPSVTASGPLWWLVPTGLWDWLLLLAVVLWPGDEARFRAAERVDLSEFAAPLPLPDHGFQWTGPMRVREVHVLGAERQGRRQLGATAPVTRIAPAVRSISCRDHTTFSAGSAEDLATESWRVEWWGSVWPDHGTGGWQRRDDPWNGRWVRIPQPPVKDDAGTWVFRLPPLTREEWPAALEPHQYAEGNVPDYRKTLKLRVVDDDGRPVSHAVLLRVFGDAYWSVQEFDLHYRFQHDGEVPFAIDVTHGQVLQWGPLGRGVLQAADPASSTVPLAGPERELSQMGERPVWVAQGRAGSSAGVRATIRYVDSPDPNGEERTRVTVRSGVQPGASGFSFVPQDVPADDAMRLPDFGFLVARAALHRTWENDTGSAAGAWTRRVRLRVAERPEATRQSAMAGLPRLSPPRDVPLGVPSARQEFFITPTGDWTISALSLNTDNGRDAARWVFADHFGNERQFDELRATLDTRPEPTFDGGDRTELRRYLEQDHLPLIHVRWTTGTLAFHHALAATILCGEYGDDEHRRGDETVVLLSQLEITNTDRRPQTATVSLRYNLHWPVRRDSDGLIRVDWPADRALPPGCTAVRGQAVEVPSNDAPQGTWRDVEASDAEHSPGLQWRALLQPGERRLLEFKSPFIELLDASELEQLRAIRFDQAVPRMVDYWQDRQARRMQLEVPDPLLNHLYRANLWHTAITTDRDPETGLYNQGVATVRYRVFGNETVMIARYMDLVGEHREAERFLEPLLHYQGSEGLTGRFRSSEGVFHGAGQYTHGQYAMNHGFVLWGVADHFRVTGDRAYLQRVAPQLVRGCDFLIRERQATLSPPGQARSPTHGLAPASSLEDVIEFQYWLAVNSYFHLGMKRVAVALAEIAHPDAKRLEREAEAYRRDIEIAAREAASHAAAVRLRDGTWIPYVPSRVFQWRHLTEGWIREALYPALHLSAGEVVSARDPLIGWMLDDLEDNVFFSEQSGYNVTDLEETWFEHGGVTLQPCLLEMVPTYLARDEIPAALRSFWNTYALSIYPDVQCFAEWVPQFGEGGGPVYKTSDEARFLIWLRQLLLWEDGSHLWYGRGLPRHWLEDGKQVRLERAGTPFGTTSLLIRSELHDARVRARIVLPDRDLPEVAQLRLRHPDGKFPRQTQVNGKSLPATAWYGEDIRLPTEQARPGEVLEIVAEY